MLQQPFCSSLAPQKGAEFATNARVFMRDKS